MVTPPPLIMLAFLVPDNDFAITGRAAGPAVPLRQVTRGSRGY
jgi:hypothetical protein